MPFFLSTCKAALTTTLLATFSLSVSAAVVPQGNDDEQLIGAVVLMRHGVRAPIESEIRGSLYNRRPWAQWPVKEGVLTNHGAEALKQLGLFYKSRYAPLLGTLARDACSNSNLFLEANTSQRTVASANALWSGLMAGCSPEVHVGPQGKPNLLFTTPNNNAALHRDAIAAAIKGRMGNNLVWFRQAFARPLADMEQVLNACSSSDTSCPPQKPDFRNTAEKIEVATGRGLLQTETPVSMGADFAEHFLLEYTEGMPMQQVGWGQVDRSMLNELMEMNTRYHDFMLRTPAYAQAGASNLAAHILATLQRAAHVPSEWAPLGNEEAHVVFLLGHDSNLAWLGGLLRLDWLLPDETFNATPPGSALTLELYRNRSTGRQTIRANFISQTLDQIRTAQPLTGNEGPAIAPVYIPGCNSYACTLDDFAKTIMNSIDDRLIEPAS